MIKKLLIVITTILATALPGLSQMTQTATTVQTGASETRPAWVALPTEYGSTSISYPLIVFLHGAGEAGNDLSVFTNPTPNGSGDRAGGPAWFIANGLWPSSFVNPRDGQQYKFIVVTPQAQNYGITRTQLKFIIEDMVSTYRVNADRIYIMAISAGGEAMYPYVGSEGVTPIYKPAAIMPLSAMMYTPNMGAYATSTVNDSIHVWGQGGTTGCDAQGEWSRDFTIQVNNRKAGFAKFTSTPQCHNRWNTWIDPAYKEGGISPYEWMLQFTRAAGTPGVNQPPVVSIGNDVVITQPTQAVSLFASASDADGTITSYLWEKISGGATTFSSTTTASVTISGLTVGTYMFRAMVADNEGASAADTVRVTVNPQSVTGNQTINVNYFSNNDPYISAAWNNIVTVSGSITASNLLNSTGASTGISAVLSNHEAAGNNGTGYTGFTGWPDKVGQYASNYPGTRTLTISGLDNSKVYRYRSLSTRASNSFVTGVQIPGFAKKLIPVGNNKDSAATFDNIHPVSQQIVVTYTPESGAGAYTYLNAWTLDEYTPTGGGSNPPNQPPVANAGNDITIQLPLNVVTLNSSQSSDDRAIVSRVWRKLTGTGGTITDSTATTTTFTGLTAGTYTIRLAVTDDSTVTRFDTIQVVVQSNANQAPIANAGPDIDVRLPQTIGSLNGIADDPDGGGDIASVKWATESAPTGPNSSQQRKYAQPGGRSFVLTPDGNGRLIINDVANVYHAGDTLFLSGVFKHISITNMEGAPGNYIVIMNKIGETTIVGDSTWSGGAFSGGLQFSTCHYIEVRGTDKDHLKFIGSKTDLLDENGYPAAGAFFNLSLGKISDNFSIHDLSIRNGGTGIWAKTEVESANSATWFPNSYMNNLDIYNTDISLTKNEGMYIGHTGSYWNISTNQPYFPGPFDPEPDPAIYKKPIKWTSVKIFDNYVHDVGLDGIQTAAIDGLEIYGNHVTNWATYHLGGHEGGLLIGGRVKGFNVTDNVVHDAWGEMCEVYAEGGAQSDIINNLFYSNQHDGVSIRGTNGLAVNFQNNTVAYSGGNAFRVNGYFGGTGTNVVTKNVFAQPLTAGGTINANSYIYKENGGLVSEPAAPGDNKKIQQASTAEWNEANFFTPMTGGNVDGFGFLRKQTTGTGYLHTIANPDMVITTVSGLTSGTFVFSFTVTDRQGLTSIDYMTITVGLNLAPTFYHFKKVSKIKGP